MKGFSLRLLSVLVFLSFCIVSLIGVSGCRILGSDDSDSGTPNVYQLGGNVFLPEGAANVTAHSTADSLRAAIPAGARPVLNALVWIEGHPEFLTQRTNASGAYLFENLPPGRYRVVVKFAQNGNTNMVRGDETEPTVPSQTPAAVQHLLGLARKFITGTLAGNNGTPLPAGTVVILWGESFPVAEDGTFTAGPLPDGTSDADLTIQQPGQTLSTALTLVVQLFSTDRATTIELQLGGNEQPLLIGATVSALKNNAPVSSANPVSPGDRLNLKATLMNIDPATAGLTYEWNPGRGRFEAAPGNTDTAIWIAPTVPGIATISLKVSAPNRGFCVVRLPITVGSAVDAPKFTVTFNAQGGSAAPSQSIDQGALITKPADPTRTGFRFLGWYKETIGTTLWDFSNDAVNAAVILYAKWVSNDVTTWQVTFNTQGGSDVQSQTIISGEKATLPNPPTKAGFSFSGWYKEVGYLNVWNFDVETVNAAVTLHAQWIADAAPICTLTYAADANGSITGTNPQLIHQGANGTAVTAVPAAGYQFVKWSDNSTANPRTDTNVTATMTYTASFAAIEGAISGDNKYAWSENSGWINFAPANGGVGSKRGANGYLNGLAWSESLGWIKFAAPGATAPFANNANNTWGVNVAADGMLSGYAWSENSGWINFGATGGNAVMNQTTGELSGFVWSESVGWIHLAGSGYKVQFGS
ncbi:MAG TPA: InlB B-repeat-containing protein [Candidatus Ozemobacteraceae bacterium]|nr:InlB B-repeat-containing protein [Candidatus Ozemobacteraceae bacterium]